MNVTGTTFLSDECTSNRVVFNHEIGVQKSIALPDVHSGYGFAIGNVAAFDMADPDAVVSPGGVGFDINCGVRLIRTNLVTQLHLSMPLQIGLAAFRPMLFAVD